MIEWDKLMTWDKEVKDYSGRKRINITNSDGLTADTKVVILLKDDYQELIADYDRLLQNEKDQNDQKDTADVMRDEIITPIYTDIINGLKQDLKDKDKEIARLKAIYQDYDKKVYSLGLLDILRHENRNISDDFNSKIWIIPDSDQVTDAEIVKFPEPSGDSGQDTVHE